MKVYLVHNAPRGERWQSQKVAAEKMGRTYKGEVEAVLVAENGREELASFLNSLDQFELPEAVVIDKAGPVTQAHVEVVTKPHKPAFTQEQVDAMFSGQSDEGPLPSVDIVCHAISEMRGAAIGHVAHELAARIERLAKGVQA